MAINLETTRLRGRPRRRCQDEVREDERIVGAEGCQEKVYNREEWKKRLKTARNHRILHMPMELMNERMMEINKWLQVLNCICCYFIHKLLKKKN